ncbi:methyltransferase domain-containing protein [Streptomyces sp. RM72]|uniref:methyltransferase domain-containing protein n=1 Tax=unclassified Streptomyces TaxID=2593676 RepID=UPI000EF59D2E|nr:MULTISPECIES: methyltransferase domain-containing protein [unclassified Streptomyces]MBQ0888720.1 methyltransferase domain-containing protein [Streptomyces sp. RM72]
MGTTSTRPRSEGPGDSGASKAPSNPFAHLDGATDEAQSHVIRYLDAAAAHHEMQRMRSAAFDAFAPAPGERLLDIGCGAGEVARQLGARVGKKGHVAAVDRSALAISVASSRHDGTPVDYAVGDITALDAPDGHFDGVRCERVLQHLTDPDEALRELIRVTRPGGRVCVIDTDWSSYAWDGFDHMTEVAGHFPFPDPGAGRTVRARMVRAGLLATTPLPVTLRFTTPEDAASVVPFFDPHALGLCVEPDLTKRFLDSVHESAERGDFLFAFTMWVTMGRLAGA